MAHCHQELEIYHAQRVVMQVPDDEYLQDYRLGRGSVITSPDGVKRRFYPRILTYSVDYPEK
jgi:hypothetical protein